MSFKWLPNPDFKSVTRLSNAIDRHASDGLTRRNHVLFMLEPCQLACRGSGTIYCTKPLLAPKTDSKRVKLSSIPQVRGVYKMTGQYNIIIKVIMAQHPEYLEEFIGLRSQV